MMPIGQHEWRRLATRPVYVEKIVYTRIRQKFPLSPSNVTAQAL
jgi:hypothetical protein